MSLTSTTIIPNPWVRILDALEKKINRHSYDTWLKPTRYSHANGAILFVRVPTAEFRHVGDKYADLIQEAVDNLGLGFDEVKFVYEYHIVVIVVLACVLKSAEIGFFHFMLIYKML